MTLCTEMVIRAIMKNDTLHNYRNKFSVGIKLGFIRWGLLVVIVDQRIFYMGMSDYKKAFQKLNLLNIPFLIS